MALISYAPAYGPAYSSPPAAAGQTTISYTPPPGYVPVSLHIDSPTPVNVGPTLTVRGWEFTFPTPPLHTPYGYGVLVQRPDGTGAYTDHGVDGTVTFPFETFPLQQLKDHLQWEDDQDEDDPELRRMLAAAVEVVADWSTYEPGTTPTPAQRLAVYMVTADLWTTQRGAGLDRDDDGNLTVSPLLTRRVRELLTPSKANPKASPQGSFPAALALPDPVRVWSGSW